MNFRVEDLAQKEGRKGRKGENKINFEGLESWLGVKNTCCFYREPGFDSQNPYGDSQPSMTSSSRDLVPSSDFRGHTYLYAHT